MYHLISKNKLIILKLCFCDLKCKYQFHNLSIDPTLSRFHDLPLTSSQWCPFIQNFKMDVLGSLVVHGDSITSIIIFAYLFIATGGWVLFSREIIVLIKKYFDILDYFGLFSTNNMLGLHQRT